MEVSVSGIWGLSWGRALQRQQPLKPKGCRLPQPAPELRGWGAHTVTQTWHSVPAPGTLPGGFGHLANRPLGTRGDILAG